MPCSLKVSGSLCEHGAWKVTPKWSEEPLIALVHFIGQLAAMSS